MNRKARITAVVALSVVAGLTPWSEPLDASAPAPPALPEEAMPIAISTLTVRTPSLRGLPRKPNIVLITADDMRPGDLKAMPFTRKMLTRQGVRFTDAISPYTLCCPARAEIVSGRHSHNNGVRGNTWPNGGYWALKHHRNTLPVWLQDTGYRTGFVGKYMNGYV